MSANAKVIAKQELRTELIRKSIHFSIALVPTLASLNHLATMILIAVGTLTYAIAESLRLSGVDIGFISRVTSLAARRRDQGRFVLGPVTLGLGALAALTFYPNPAASLAIYALAFGDGLASLVGKAVGRIRLPFTGGKSLEGSLACFLAVFLISVVITGRTAESIAIASVATVVEAMPLKDWDNIFLPATVGAVASVLFR